MRFYVNFGQNKDKNKHIVYIGERKKLDFSIIVSQFNKVTNEKEYAYMKAETWDKDIIDLLEEKRAYNLDKFYFRWFKDKQNNIQWVVVVQDIKEIIKKKNEEVFNMEELGEIFGDTLTNNKDKDKKEEDWELDF